MLEANSKAWPVLAALGALLVFRLIGGGVLSDEAVATTLGPFDFARDNGTGEILEPSASRFAAPPRNDGSITGGTVDLHDFLRPAIGKYDGLVTQPDSEMGNVTKLEADISAIESYSSVHHSFTALEWIQQWAESGYWLENDQWADFKAIAIASYLPEIRYWLGRDRWSYFGAMTFGGETKDTFGKLPLDQGDFLNAAQPDTVSYGGASGKLQSYGGKLKTDQVANTPVTVYDFMVSLINKMALQPLFYLLLLVGIGLVLWVIKKQSTA